MVGQQLDIALAVAQVRQPDFDGVQPEQQIFAKTASGNLCSHVHVGGGEHADVYAAGVRRPHPLELSRFQHAQQLGLKIQRHVGDFIQKKRAAVRKLKSPDTIRACIRERAFHVAE